MRIPPIDKIVTKDNANEFVGVYLETQRNDVVHIMSYCAGYFMMRHKGAMPFVRMVSDVNQMLSDGVYKISNLKKRIVK